VVFIDNDKKRGSHSRMGIHKWKRGHVLKYTMEKSHQTQKGHKFDRNNWKLKTHDQLPSL